MLLKSFSLTIILFMNKQSYSIKFFFISLLLSIGIGHAVNGQTVEMDRVNSTTGGNGTVTSRGDVMRYFITSRNATSSNITSSTIYGYIPTGTVYVAGSTKVNGVAVSDVNGKMPFAASGGLVNSPLSGPGVLAPNTTATIEFEAMVTAKSGALSDSAILQATTIAGPVLVTSNTVSTQLNNDPHDCSIIYQTTSTVSNQTVPYRYVNTVNPTNGTRSSLASFSGPSGPCYNAITGASLPTGTVLVNAEAIGYDVMSNRLYFVNTNTNNTAEDLCFIDFKTSPVCARKFVGYPLETNTGAGYNISRMAFITGDRGPNYGYALTANSQDLIRFSVDVSTGLPVITPLGALINDANNGANNILAEAAGDMFTDGYSLYLVPNSGRMYRIDPATRIATYVGTINGMPAGGANSVAIDQSGYIYISGNYQNVYRVDLTTMDALSIISGASNVYKNGDYASCPLLQIAPALKATKTYRNTTGSATVISGDSIEYTIEVTNTGNMGAPAVKLYDALPAGSHYIPNSTTVNGVAVADINGLMPFAVPGGQLINSPAESAGVVKPGVANKALIKFRVFTEGQKTICNQASVSFSDHQGNSVYVFSDDPVQPGSQDATCFYSNAGTMQATKTWRCPFTNATQVVAGDPVEYTITVTNTGSVNATGVTVYDAIPANSQYMAGTTKMNGVDVADIGGVMPFAVSGGQLVNSSGEAAGVITPGIANKVTVTFMVKTNPGTTVCNQATITYQYDGNNRVIITDNPATSGTWDATCFYSDVPPLGGRIAVNSTPNVQLAIIESAQVRPNPFVTNLNLQVQLNNAETVQVRLFDLYGRTVFTTFQKLGAGVNSLNLNVPSGLSKGIYVLEVKAGTNQVLQKKLLKQ
jgi:uncharacterized repeat protein (TIGR01451 family)